VEMDWVAGFVEAEGGGVCVGGGWVEVEVEVEVGVVGWVLLGGEHDGGVTISSNFLGCSLCFVC